MPTRHEREGDSAHLLNEVAQGCRETRELGESPRENLLRAAVGGDRAALNELLFLYFDPLQEFVERHHHRRSHGVLETEDILQETFVRAIRGLAKFNPTTEDSFERWLVTIARRATQSLATAAMAEKRGGKFRQIRQCKVLPAGTLVDQVDLLLATDGTGSGVAAANEAVQALQRQIACLPADNRQAVEFKLLQGMSLDETAQAMDRSPAAVRGLLDRAKLRLRATLGRSSRWFGR